MRIWDIHPGYLNRQSLLGEHRELHGLVSIMVNGKKGYSRHPETVRWLKYGWAIRQRHRQLVAEMALRGYRDQSPVRTRSNSEVWPATYIDPPWVQFELLREKYRDKDPGRIPLPINQQALWSHHKYSMLARDPKRYREIGAQVANGQIRIEALALELTESLRVAPSEGGLRNALQHMWGHVSSECESGQNFTAWSLQRLLQQIQQTAKSINEPYLTRATALSELQAWL